MYKALIYTAMHKIITVAAADTKAEMKKEIRNAINKYWRVIKVNSSADIYKDDMIIGKMSIKHYLQSAISDNIELLNINIKGNKKLINGIEK